MIQKMVQYHIIQIIGISTDINASERSRSGLQQLFYARKIDIPSGARFKQFMIQSSFVHFSPLP